MERNDYRVFRSRPDLIYLDASNGFPLHDHVIERVHTLAGQYVGMPGKGAYGDAAAVSNIVEETRAKVAQLINASTEDVYFVSSATEAARLIAQAWCLDDSSAIVAYSLEDHTATARALERLPRERTHRLTYNEMGQLSDMPEGVTVCFINHLHHLYGSDIVPAQFKENDSKRKLVVDASQSIARLTVDVKRQRADALYFSGHKLGAMPGTGVLFIAPEYRGTFTDSSASLPWLTIASMGAAIDVLTQKPMGQRSMYLAELTSYLIARLEEVPDISFSKGVVGALDVCDGNGIISFKIRGYASSDIMMLLDEYTIAVRGGDHCVSPEYADRDYVRISMQAYTTQADIDTLVRCLHKLAG